MCPPQPAPRAREIGRPLDVQLDPSTTREAAMRPDARVGRRASPVVAAQPDPQIVLLLAQRKHANNRSPTK
jgi:hypothetical protein